MPTLTFLVLAESTASGRCYLLLLYLLVHFSFFIMESWSLFLIFVIVVIVLLIVFFYFVVCILFTVLFREVWLEFGFIVLSLFNKKCLCASESFNGFCLLLCSTLISHHLIWMWIISSYNESFPGILIDGRSRLGMVLGYLLSLFVWRKTLRIHWKLLNSILDLVVLIERKFILLIGVFVVIRIIM